MNPEPIRVIIDHWSITNIQTSWDLVFLQVFTVWNQNQGQSQEWICSWIWIQVWSRDPVLQTWGQSGPDQEDQNPDFSPDLSPDCGSQRVWTCSGFDLHRQAWSRIHWDPPRREETNPGQTDQDHGRSTEDHRSGLRSVLSDQDQQEEVWQSPVSRVRQRRGGATWDQVQVWGEEVWDQD